MTMNDNFAVIIYIRTQVTMKNILSHTPIVQNNHQIHQQIIIMMMVNGGNAYCGAGKIVNFQKFMVVITVLKKTRGKVSFNKNFCLLLFIFKAFSFVF